jgi:hypothetical protein
MELDLSIPASQPPSLAQLHGVPTNKNTFSSIKEFSVKITKLYIGIIYSLATILFWDGESPNSFELGICRSAILRTDSEVGLLNT